jgi:hypothetical protein
MIPLTDERKQQIIDEQPDGLWLVLNEEYRRDESSITELLGAEPEQVPSE